MTTPLDPVPSVLYITAEGTAAVEEAARVVLDLMSRGVADWIGHPPAADDPSHYDEAHIFHEAPVRVGATYLVRIRRPS